MTIMVMLPALGGMASSLSSSQRAVGYTVTDQIDYEGVMVGEADTYTMGAYMPAARLEDYKGCKIVGIRLAAACDLGRTGMVLNTPDESGSRTLHEQKQRIYQGWNDVFFNGFEYEITADEDIFYGFDYVETEKMVADETGGLCTVGEDYSNSFVLHRDGAYYPVTGAGKLCVQLIVDISNMAPENMSIGYFDFGFKYKKADEGLPIFASFTNAGLNAVDNFRLACTIDGGEPIYEDIAPDKPLAFGEYYTLDKTFPLSGVESGGHDVKIYVDQINGKDYAGLPRGKGGKIAIYSESMPRTTTYIEVYADQNNYNSANLDDGLKLMKEDLGDMVTVVKNYRPGNSLAVTEAGYLHSLYAYTWPSFTSNRSHFPGESHVAYDMNDYLSIFPGEFTAEILKGIVEQDHETPSFADLQLNATLGEGRMLEVNASGSIMQEAKSIYGDLVLTLMVVEDQVRASQMSTGGKTNLKYYHDDVLRGYVTPAKGVVIDSSKPAFSEKFSIAVPEAWNIQNLRITGILTQSGEPEEENLYDFDVINAASVKVVDPSGIIAISADMPEGESAYYNLQGMPVDKDDHSGGLYIRIGADGKARKVMK